jgi:hypothetical protein
MKKASASANQNNQQGITAYIFLCIFTDPPLPINKKYGRFR